MKHLKKFNEGVTIPKHGEKCDCSYCKDRLYQEDMDDVRDMFLDIADNYNLEKVTDDYSNIPDNIPPTDDDINLDNTNCWFMRFSGNFRTMNSKTTFVSRLIVLDVSFMKYGDAAKSRDEQKKLLGDLYKYVHRLNTTGYKAEVETPKDVDWWTEYNSQQKFQSDGHLKIYIKR